MWVFGVGVLETVRTAGQVGSKTEEDVELMLRLSGQELCRAFSEVTRALIPDRRS